MLLPLIGEGRDGECPARDSRRHSEQRSRAERDSESHALGLDFFSFPDLGKAGMGSVPQGKFNHICNLWLLLI